MKVVSVCCEGSPPHVLPLTGQESSLPPPTAPSVPRTCPTQTTPPSPSRACPGGGWSTSGMSREDSIISPRTASTLIFTFLTTATRNPAKVFSREIGLKFQIKIYFKRDKVDGDISYIFYIVNRIESCSSRSFCSLLYDAM